MRFGKNLESQKVSEWKEHYLDYAKLKSLLKEDDPRDDETSWTERDESNFCDEFFNVQFQKVVAFHTTTIEALEKRAEEVGTALQELAPSDGQNAGDITRSRFRNFEEDLDDISNEANRLKSFDQLNFTACRKIVKKHDRKRGHLYRIRPMLQLNVDKSGFNDDKSYAPLLEKMSAMYFIVRQNLDDAPEGLSSSFSDVAPQSQNGERYTAYKFIVSMNNYVEVKSYILRRLPLLVYSEQASASSPIKSSKEDPTMTSLYFDNRQFSLYTQKVERKEDASSLRLRWYGGLKDKPELFFEQKTVHQNGSSEEKRFSIKDKYVQPFIRGEYNMEKTSEKMGRQHQLAEKVAEFRKTVNDVQEFIKEHDLQPVLRANYTRTAFQKPLDDRVRISIDTDLAFIREDALDTSRPCRNSNNWHRTDVDNNDMVFPFSDINEGEVSVFPHAILEIKVRQDAGRKTPLWVQDLMASHLLFKAPEFSKFVKGVSSLFEDYVNTLPVWLNQVEGEIEKSPEQAFEEEEQAKLHKAENELMVGSYLGTSKLKAPYYKAATSSPLGRSILAERAASDGKKVHDATNDKAKSLRTNKDAKDGQNKSGYGTISAMSQFSRKHVVLPPGVTKPTQLIKDLGELKVEPKVWLANERTFLKWQHICILLGSLAVGLYTAAGQNTLAEFMGIAYIVIAIFAGGWGWSMYYIRRDMIRARSGKDFDNLIGPIIVSIALMVALILNFIFKYQAAIQRLHGDDKGNMFLNASAPFRAELI